MGTQTFSVSIPLGPTPHPLWSEALTIPKFDLGRPLQRLDLTISLRLKNVLAFESTSGLASKATVSHMSSLAITDLGGRSVSINLANEATKTLARRDGTTDYSGPSGFDTSCSRTVIDACTIFNVAPYVGSGGVDFPISGAAESRFSGPAAGSFKTATDYSVEVTGIYTYAD